jgi:iron complex outermembrane receptor protein
LPVTGAIAGRNPANKDWLIIGAGGQADTVQDHAKVKLAYDFSPTLRASYTLGWWGNEAVRGAESYLRDANGAPVYRGDGPKNFINIAGTRYELRASDLAPSIGKLDHLMQGVSLKRHTRGEWDWEVAASQYDYRKDLVRTPTVLVADTGTGGAGMLTDLAGSGWNTLALKGIWRPTAAHVVEVGAQSDSAKLRNRVSGSADWIGGAPAATSIFNGNTRLQSLYAQDSWRFAPLWRATLGARAERWHAYGGELSKPGAAPLPFGFERIETSISPKTALAFAATPDWTLKASLGRAVRNPTAAELFQGSIVENVIVNSDPSLRAEKSWTGELSAERVNEAGVLRATMFIERTRDALYSQRLTETVNTVQNIGRIRTNGFELAYQADDVLVQGLTVSSSLTYADSIITDNRALPASVGKRQPRVPAWRANLLASWHAGQHWTSSFGVRYSGRQYGALDNSDPHGDTYMGVSDYLVSDVRLRYRFNDRYSASVGIDNLGNAKYWAFHPYPQRTVLAEARFDY